MHTAIIVIASWIAITVTVCGVMLPVEWVMVGLIVSVAMVGVPHGGLDHWTGRRILSPYFRDSWWLVFFPAYLLVAVVVIAGWFLAPVGTALLFFLLSAWHFGHEEMLEDVPSWGRLVDSVASGGLVIWISVLLRPDEVGQILKAVLPVNMFQHVRTILTISQSLAIPLTACAVAFMLNDIRQQRYLRAVRKISFGCLFSFVDVLVSFGLYFCGWHSVRGLSRLAKENDLSPSRMLLAVAPLSIGAILLGAIGMWTWSSGPTTVESWHRTLFISLSAIAVPHLVLHGPITQLMGYATDACSRPHLPVERAR